MCITGVVVLEDSSSAVTHGMNNVGTHLKTNNTKPDGIDGRLVQLPLLV